MWAAYAFLLGFVLWQRFAPPGPNKLEVNWSAVTARRALGLAGIFVLLLILPHLVAAGFDLPFLFSLDITFMTDLSALLIIIGVQETVEAYIRPITAVGRNMLSALRLIRRNVMRATKRARRTRPKKTSAPSSEETDGNWAFA